MTFGEIKNLVIRIPFLVAEYWGLSAGYGWDNEKALRNRRRLRISTPTIFTRNGVKKYSKLGSTSLWVAALVTYIIAYHHQVAILVADDKLDCFGYSRKILALTKTV